MTATIEDLIKDAGKYTLGDAKMKDTQWSLFKAKEDELEELDKMEESLYITKKRIFTKV